MFEAWKARPEVAPLPAREFVRVHIDLSRTPGGRELHDRYPAAKNGGIPWFLIQDGQGKPLADSNGPSGNIGCPSSDAEISFFRELLHKVCRSLTEEESAVLKRSLEAARPKR